MKKVRKLAGLLLALVMVLSLNITALADTPVTGTITITNATIGQSYHIFKLFDATVSSEGVNYIATSSQKTALEAVDDNVFAFVQITEDTYSVTYEDEGQTVTKTVTKSEMADLTGSGVIFSDGPVLVEEGTYYVTVGTDSSTGTTFADEKVIDFISSYVSRLSSTMMMCNFPGAEEEYATKTNSIDGETVAVAVVGLDGDRLATQSTVTFSGLPLGYYFITSSLGATVSLNTTRKSVSVVDKNKGTPTWDNDPANPDDPVKAVLDTAGRDINEEEVAVGDTLTYQISYTNESGETLTDVTLTDTIPEYSEYVPGSIGISFLDENGETIDLSNYTNAGIGTVTRDDTTTTLKWTVAALPDEYTLVATFQVTVADTTTSVTIENDADLTVTLGENTYDLKTNKVENPVYPGPKPEKDVYAAETKEYVTGTDIDGNKVTVGDILTYQITYTNEDDDAVELIIKDAPPTGTVFVAGSAKGTIQSDGSTETTDITEDADNSIEIAADGTITWTIGSLASGATVKVSFQVEVTAAAITIVDSTIENSAEGTIGGNEYKTNTVKNPTGGTPDPGDNGKVIVNADGSKSTESTGSFGDTVTFDVSIDAVNTVASSDTSSTATTTQVTAYYIYDLLGAGFDLDDIAKNGYLTIGDTKYSLYYTEDATSGAKCYQFLDSSNDEVGTLFTYDNTDGTTLIAVTIPWVDGNNGYALYSNCEVHLIYTATINTDAEIGDNGNQNKAIFDYSTAEDPDPTEPDPKEPEYPSGSDLNHGSDEKTTTTYTYALAVQKISQESGVALEGATFTLVDAAGYSIYAVPVTDTNGNVSYYNYTSDSTVTGATNKFTTNSDGQIIIKGVDIGTYSFTETKAPAGYTLLGGSVSVTAKMNSSATTKTYTSSTVTRYFEAVTEDEWATVENVYIKDDTSNEFTLAEKPSAYSSSTTYYKLVSSSSSSSIDGSLTVTNEFDVEVVALYVENSSGSLLPSTGGIGTTIFYIVGGLLVFGAVVVLITRRRMDA